MVPSNKSWVRYKELISVTPNPKVNNNVVVWLLGRYKFAKPCRHSYAHEEGINMRAKYIIKTEMAVKINKHTPRPTVKYIAVSIS